MNITDAIDLTGDALAEDGFKIIRFDGFDEAVTGMVYDPTPLLVYSYSRMIEVLMKDMPYEEATEYFDFNILGAMFEGKPLIMFDLIGESERAPTSTYAKGLKDWAGRRAAEADGES